MNHEFHKFSRSHGESGPGTSWTRQIRRPFAGSSSRSKRAGKIWCPGRGYQVVPRWFPGGGREPKKSLRNPLWICCYWRIYVVWLFFLLNTFWDILSKYLYRWTIYDVNTCPYRSTIDTIDISIVVGFVGYCIENSITTDFQEWSIQINGSTILRLHPN